MSIEVTDLRPTIIPKSDQLNADQLVAGPVIITVTRVEVSSSKEQPVIVHYEGEGGRPYKPGLTMRKVLLLAWGENGNDWVGRSMELFHDPSIKFGNDLVGGIRIARLSDIPKDIKVSLAEKKGKKALHEIGVLRQSDALVKALAAIAAATNKAEMQKARALAENVPTTELASAREAYRLKVSVLKEAAEKKPEPPKTDDTHASLLSSYLEMIEKATDADTATLALDEARDVLTADEHEKLTDAWRTKFQAG